jgi:20S proteasome alpha/beta subunit
MQDFYTGLQQRLIQPLVGSIDQQVITYNYGVELLIAGVDGDGAHLHAIENPGTEEDFAQIGYAAIGSGGLHALQSMIGFGHAGMHGLNDTVFSVYASKRRAEVAPGVGKDTDLAIITEDSIQYLEQSVLKELDALYGEYQRPVMQDLKSKVAELSFLKKRGE